MNDRPSLPAAQGRTLGDFIAGGSLDVTDWRPEKIDADAERYERLAADPETEFFDAAWARREAANLRHLARIRRQVIARGESR